MENRVGQQIGHYRLVRLLGRGGFANVYLGEHVHLKTEAAIKILQIRLAGNTIEQFRSEAQTIASLVHPHIVRVLDFGEEDGIPYLVMDYAPGGTLRTRHPRGTRLPPGIIVSYVKQVAEALQYAHDKNLIHRDVKPENMLLGQNNNLLLSDFGLVLVAQSSRSRSMKEIAGTVPYMAPEQIQGKPSPASDQYALGIVVYEWLSGTPPFQGAAFELFGQHLHASPPSLREKIPELPLPIEGVVMTALAKDPQQRFADMRTFASALERAYEGAQPTPPGISIVPTRPYQSLPPTVVEASRDQRAEPTQIETPPGQSLVPTVVNTPSGQSSPQSQAFSQVPKTEMALPAIEGGQSAGGPPAGRPRSKAGRWWLAAVLVMLVLLLIFGSIAYAMSGGFVPLVNKFLGGSSGAKGPLAASSATITITPASKDLKNLYTISAVTGTPGASQHQVQARTISTTESQSQTANATGTQAVPGVNATGEILVFTNLSASYPAGSIFTGNSGVQVATDADVNLPDSAGNDSMRVAAHAITAGSSGNIPAGDINQGSNAVFSCPIASGAMSDIVGSNMPEHVNLSMFMYPKVPSGGSTTVVCNPKAFTGGKDAYKQSVVQQVDVNNAYGDAKSLEPALDQKAQNSLHAGVQTNEQLISSPQCTSNFSYDHAVSDVAKRVTATITVTCTGEVYDQQGALAMASLWLKQDAARNPGSGYALVGKVLTNQTQAKVSNADQGTIAVSVTAEGVWVFQVSGAQKLALVKLVAGKKKGIVQSLLLQQQGVSKVDIKLVGGDVDIFPRNSGKITVVVLNVKGK
ncbi:MAG TPA: protein kinase [Ktedonobacteraceae bacterium]